MQLQIYNKLLKNHSNGILNLSFTLRLYNIFCYISKSIILYNIKGSQLYSYKE